MISKIIDKISFIKKFPKKIAKPLLISIIFFDEIFWKLRMFLFISLFGKKKKICKAFLDLKRNFDPGNRFSSDMFQRLME